MEQFTTRLIEICTAAASRVVLALVIFIIGRFIVRRLLKMIGDGRGFSRLDPSLRSFTENFLKALLYIILVISIIGVLGVPMASVITVLASAGVAVGMALQGALGNLAGGIMLLLFRPFNVGDYIKAAEVEGRVRDLTLFYTVLITDQNTRVTIPNGSLMNTNITNCTSEDRRRVDLTFSCAKGENIAEIQRILAESASRDPRVLTDPAPFARISGGNETSMEFTVRAWTHTSQYWPVHFDLLQSITEDLALAGVKSPATRVITGNDAGHISEE